MRNTFTMKTCKDGARGLVRAKRRWSFAQLPLTRAVVACACTFAAVAAGAAQFNFSYQFGGERKILPLQVFDDGTNTYFQFRQSNAMVPVIMSESGGQSYVSNYSVYGPYVVVPGVASSYRLKFGALEASIVQTGGRATVAVPTPENPAAASPLIAVATTAEPRTVATRYVSYGPVNPVVGAGVPAASVGRNSQVDVAGIVAGGAVTFRIPFAVDSSKLTPSSMKAISEALRGQDEIGSVTVIGRDDHNYKDGVAADRARVLAGALVRYGVPEGRITQRVGIPRDDDKTKVPTSDLVITRVAARSSASVNGLATQDVPAGQAPLGAVSSALNAIRQGLVSLVRLGWMTQARSDAAMEVIAGSGPKQGAPTAEALVATGKAPSAAAASMASATETWTMTPADGSVLDGLAKWAARAGMEFESRSGVDYPIKGVITVRGDAKAAVRHVEGLLSKAKQPIRARFEGNKLVIEG